MERFLSNLNEQCLGSAITLLASKQLLESGQPGNFVSPPQYGSYYPQYVQPQQKTLTDKLLTGAKWTGLGTLAAGGLLTYNPVWARQGMEALGAGMQKMGMNSWGQAVKDNAIGAEQFFGGIRAGAINKWDEMSGNQLAREGIKSKDQYAEMLKQNDLAQKIIKAGGQAHIHSDETLNKFRDQNGLSATRHGVPLPNRDIGKIKALQGDSESIKAAKAEGEDLEAYRDGQ